MALKGLGEVNTEIVEIHLRDRGKLLDMAEDQYQDLRKSYIELGVSEDEFLLVDECRRMGQAAMNGVRV